MSERRQEQSQGRIQKFFEGGVLKLFVWTVIFLKKTLENWKNIPKRGGGVWPPKPLAEYAPGQSNQKTNSLRKPKIPRQIYTKLTHFLQHHAIHNDTANKCTWEMKSSHHHHHDCRHQWMICLRHVYIMTELLCK